MAENQEKNQPKAESYQKVIIKTRSLTRRQQGDRNYPLIQQGREIIQRNYNNIKTIINRNYRRFSY